MSPLDKRDEADRMKRTFCKNTCSDHLALLRAFEGWRNARSRNEEWSYCRRFFVSNTTLRMIDEMRKQFFELLIGIGFVREIEGGGNNRNHRRSRRWQEHLLNGPHNANASNLSLIRSVICAGLYPNILRIMPTKKEGEEPKIKAKDGEVFVHPVSVNFQEKRFNSRKLLVCVFVCVRMCKIHINMSNSQLSTLNSQLIFIIIVIIYNIFSYTWKRSSQAKCIFETAVRFHRTQFYFLVGE